MSTSLAHENMIKQQIRTMNITDPKIIDILTATPRDAFVPNAHKALAYSETMLPLPFNQHMLTPAIEAEMLKAAQLKPTDKVLEVGTGSGYFTALLAKASHHVFSVEQHDDLVLHAAQALFENHVHNITLDTGDAAQGWDQHGPYDAIVITGSLPILPEAFTQALTLGGRLIAVLGDAPTMELTRTTRASNNDWHTEVLLETVIPCLDNVDQPERFAF